MGADILPPHRSKKRLPQAQREADRCVKTTHAQVTSRPASIAAEASRTLYNNMPALRGLRFRGRAIAECGLSPY